MCMLGDSSIYAIEYKQRIASRLMAWGFCYAAINAASLSDVGIHEDQSFCSRPFFVP